MLFIETFSELVVVAQLGGGVKVRRKIVRAPSPPPALRVLPRRQRRSLYLPPGLLFVRFPGLLEGAVDLWARTGTREMAAAAATDTRSRLSQYKVNGPGRENKALFM